ncbi:Rpn family recombination-promoting nuclease/putative transposase [Jiangella anatolica]|uniref:Transposase n=1 Tax=Jiangella anatolica TaxID=2670374 RepID=A0A2W2BAW9_9ACTN|nr:Rpn family recombination-promoting nuclease/putative transposase [Jiangella anatolica]PZF82390.1 transposase [Jiangella anatolica]
MADSPATLSVPPPTVPTMSNQPNPHDAVFRRVLGEPVNAASQLRAVLPAGLSGRLDLDQLARVPGSFVDAALRWRHSDLLFTAPVKGGDVLLYVLIEHQSSTDPLMPFRMLRYVVRIWDRYLAEHPDATRLPAVIPLVVHHNRRPWSGPADIVELLDLDAEAVDAAREHLPRFRFLLDDLARLDQRALRARPLTPPARITLLLLKIAAGNARLADDLRDWTDDLRQILTGAGGIDDFLALLTYIETVGETPTDQLHQLFTQLGPEEEEAYVTTAEMLRAEGHAKALVQLLTLKFGPLTQSTLDTVHAASSAQLESWTARVLTAQTLDDVL